MGAGRRGQRRSSSAVPEKVRNGIAECLRVQRPCGQHRDVRRREEAAHPVFDGLGIRTHVRCHDRDAECAGCEKREVEPLPERGQDIEVTCRDAVGVIRPFTDQQEGFGPGGSSHPCLERCALGPLADEKKPRLRMSGQHPLRRRHQEAMTLAGCERCDGGDKGRLRGDAEARPRLGPRAGVVKRGKGDPVRHKLKPPPRHEFPPPQVATDGVRDCDDACGQAREEGVAGTKTEGPSVVRGLTGVEAHRRAGLDSREGQPEVGRAAVSMHDVELSFAKEPREGCDPLNEGTARAQEHAPCGDAEMREARGTHRFRAGIGDRCVVCAESKHAWRKAPAIERFDQVEDQVTYSARRQLRNGEENAGRGHGLEIGACAHGLEPAEAKPFRGPWTSPSCPWTFRCARSLRAWRSRLVANRRGTGVFPRAVGSPTSNVGRWLAQQATLAGERVAVIDRDRTLDYRGLEGRCARLAQVLSEAQVRRGSRVALLLGNRSAFLEAVFAAARLGALSVPINARLAPPEIAGLFDDCMPSALIYEDALARIVDAACAMAGCAPAFRLSAGGTPDAYECAIAGAAPAFGIEPVDPEDPMMILYTSGTTGVPKGAVLPHRKTLFNSLNAQLFFQITAADRVLIAIPLFHSFGLNILSLPILYAGGSLVLEPRFEPESVWDAVSVRGITFFGAVPTMLQALLEALQAAPSGKYRLGSLRFLFSAGAAIPIELIRAFESHGLVVKQGFGQTETSILCCLDARDALRKAGSVGRPVFHSELRIVTQPSAGRSPSAWIDVKPGEPGEIVVRGPITMSGYWQRPEATAETIREGWLRTGDLGVFDEDGFVTLVGRARDLYISGGENVYPAEVERVYAKHEAIREISVVGVPDRRWGEVGQAYVILAPGKALDEEALRAWGRERLASFKIPQRFVAVSRLPRTETGKVQKHRLRQPD